MSSSESRVSRTSPRRPAVRLVLLNLCCGNAILITPLCWICGQEACDRLDESGDSVLLGFGVDPETVFAGGAGRDRAYARDPGPSRIRTASSAPKASTKFSTVELAVKVKQSISPDCKRTDNSSLPSDEGTD